MYLHMYAFKKFLYLQARKFYLFRQKLELPLNSFQYDPIDIDI